MISVTDDTIPTHEDVIPTKRSRTGNKIKGKNGKHVEHRSRHKSRRRKAIAKREALGDSWQADSYIMGLPLELLAEVLIHTQSPHDVLAVARTCRYFCKTLLGSPAMFIWRSVRKSCRPDALPEPYARFTESAYTAFVFDEGTCEVCKKPTGKMYTSFALKLRLCKDKDCWNNIQRMEIKSILIKVKNTPENNNLLQYVPKLESPACLVDTGHRHNAEVMIDATQSICQRQDWERISDEYSVSVRNDELDAFNASHEALIKPTEEWNAFCLKLVKWQHGRTLALEKVESENQNYAKAFAVKKGYKFWDLMCAPTYQDLHKKYTRDLLHITDLDIVTKTAAIETELVTISENRKRRDYEHLYADIRNQVEIIYREITTSNHFDHIFPALSTFRKLPILSQLQTTLTVGPKGKDNAIEKALTKNVSTRSLISKQLDQWRGQAQEDFNDILGYKDWKSPSSSRLPPAQRVTARFICTLCTKTPMDKGTIREDRILDFKGACLHECFVSPNSKKYNEWKAENFVKYKGVAVMEDLMKLLGIDPEDVNSPTVFANCTTGVVCRSCDPPLLIKPASVLMHCQRHDAMKVGVYDETTSSVANPIPYEKGLTSRLMQQTEQTKRFKDLKNYACRHCAKNRVKKNPLLNINGLKSHMLRKHGVKVMLDEDYSCHEPLKWE